MNRERGKSDARDGEATGPGRGPAGDDGRVAATSSREERLALQLRENLKKRKALARARRQSDDGR